VYRSNRVLPAVVIPILAVVAIVAYLIGIHGSSGASGGEATTARSGPAHVGSSGTVLFEYPASWQRVSAMAAVPGIAIAHPFLLAPGGDAARAGLFSGQLAGNQASPLPQSFLTRLHGVPHTEVVSLANVQAYRYSQLTVPGFNRIVDLYVIPDLGAASTIVACDAASGDASDLHQCEEIVDQLTLVGQSADVLSPENAYAAQLSPLLSKLEQERATLRREIHARENLEAVAPLASALSTRFANVAEALLKLEPPPAASAAQTALAAAIAQARSSYSTLAAAASADSPSEYALAKQQVEAAEAGVDAALESFDLLGYGHSQR